MSGGRRPALLRLTAVAAAAVALGFLTGRDGAPLWQVARVLGVALLAATAGAATLRLGRPRRGVAPVLVGIAATAAGAGIAAGEVPDEQAVAALLQATAPERVEVRVVPGAGHTGSLATAPDEWTARVLAFLDVALAPED